MADPNQTVTHSIATVSWIDPAAKLPDDDRGPPRSSLTLDLFDQKFAMHYRFLNILTATAYRSRQGVGGRFEPTSVLRTQSTKGVFRVEKYPVLRDQSWVTQRDA